MVLAADPIFAVDAPFKIGLELGGKLALSAQKPLPPIVKDPPHALSPILLHDCDTCHKLQFYLDGFIKSDEINIMFMGDTKFRNVFSVTGLKFERLSKLHECFYSNRSRKTQSLAELSAAMEAIRHVRMRLRAFVLLAMIRLRRLFLLQQLRYFRLRVKPRRYP